MCRDKVSTSIGIAASFHYQMELPADLDGFHAVLKRRIRDQNEIEECRHDYSAEKKVAAQRAVAARVRYIGAYSPLQNKPANGSFSAKDQWQQYTWGNAERLCLYSEDSTTTTKPTPTPSISEKIRVHDSKDRVWTIDRVAKFVAVSEALWSLSHIEGLRFE
ncbi:unnamed protein product [Phytophthora lilii]|uniref:Unnamed protein product n=1 Tax=Phytophthora lilii TaxID=2077276 RepID=A0A9W6TNP6_9STRA|nr:unnamed protein product [Phytophthora lilii]